MRPSFLALALLLAPAAPAAADLAPASELTAKVEEYMTARVDRDRFSGTILIAHDSKPIVRRAYGMANLELDVPCKPESIYRLGSITKQFTATAVLILQEQGKLKVSDPVGKHVAKTPKTWDKITIEHLLTHTSGIPNYTGLASFSKLITTKLALTELIATFKDLPLRFPPGEKFEYSNSGYIVLGQVIETAAGKTYEQFLKEVIFDPLGMRDTAYDHPTPIVKNRAAGYGRFLGLATANADYIDMSLPHAAGALHSTVDDLLKWDQAIATAKLVPAKSLEAMFTPRKGNYGYGWMIEKRFGQTRQEHGGRIPGFVAMIARFPAEKLLIVILSNQDFAPVSRIGDDLAAIALGQPYVVPRLPKPIVVDAKALDLFTGEYEVDRPQGEKRIVKVAQDGKRLVIGPKEGKSVMLAVPESSTGFYVLFQDVAFEFDRDKEGAVLGFTMIEDNERIKARRLPAAKAAADATPKPLPPAEAGKPRSGS